MEPQVIVDAGLTTCDREPIHIPGSVQPHGVMLVTRRADMAICHAAGPVETLLGNDTWQNAPLAALIGEQLAARSVDLTGSRAGSVYIGQLLAPAERLLDVSAYLSGDLLIVELEPAAPNPLPAARILDLLEEAASQFERAPSIEALCDRAAVLLRRLTGFDRVMIYHFMESGAGQVLAEARGEQHHSFLHHHFPASDIPEQARALYTRNLTRVIPDIDYAPAPLRPPWNGPEPLDMSDSTLRSVSPIHLQYLRNMGVAVSASVSIIVDGVLWGLVACHHAMPRLMTYDVRAACRGIAASLARQLRVKQEAEDYRERIRLRTRQDDLLRVMGADEDGLQPPLAYLNDLRVILDADGFAVLRGADLLTTGVTPSRGEIRDLANWVLARGGPAVQASSALETVYPSASLFREHGSGVLSVVFDAERHVVLLWFRSEQIEQIKWAGIPWKPDNDPEMELTPRSSFEAWQETVRGRSREWSDPHVEAAGWLREHLLERRRTREVRELNQQLSASLVERDGLLEQKDFLMGEVNHRVQNSLQLVASFLSMQGRMSSSPELRTELNEAQRRLSAVALVHRRLYSGDQIQLIDAARYVEELCADAIASMGGAWSQFLSLDLVAVQIPTDRAVTLGLVLTELLININKYAYAGQPGPIEVKLAPAPEGFRLEVADAGSSKVASGAVTSGKIAAGKGFGSRMIAGMVAQLRGTLTYEDNQPGLRATMVAPLETPK